MLYYFEFGPLHIVDKSKYVFRTMVRKKNYSGVLYGVFCYTGNRNNLIGGFSKVKYLEIGQDAWFKDAEWIPCE